MSYRFRIILLSSLLLGLMALCCVLTIQAYHNRMPFVGRMFYGTGSAAGTGGNPEASEPLWGGLKPGADEPHGMYYKGRVLVLMYHEVEQAPHDAAALSAAKFERQLELMKRNNFHWITMDQYRSFILHGDPVPDNAVLLTFDDGYESFYRYAYPILRKYGAPATSFLIAGTIGNPHHAGVPKLNWNQVKEMHRNGIAFYSHSYDSHRYEPTDAKGRHMIAALTGPVFLKDKGRRETEQEYEHRVKTDLEQANTVLDRELGAPNHVLAFPYGAFSKPLLHICSQLGIDVTLTVKDGLDGPGQSNGFRLNAGGAQNDPDMQLALMKLAKEKLGHAHFDRAPQQKREALWTLTAMAAIAVVLLMSIRNRKREKRRSAYFMY
ncbi:polysaccharide deacetylase family protein [Paenibacillus sacheonensis]|uniref:Polysaccharide deacetylase family protein n=1 Tax=Paenibacillus sacheonensis TaxID=742054 RepID=A0A7X5BZC9_9BACL|nr:polysaccharide deacetylase family protein [Paenibacillus sacheonensis]MBM7566392.1 biofilm PGA synthesis lipoprotein PgaB [Paenibacillus sacheonensis]NBC70592.1 polysaccharide deacetylase family protein [Paenibacillus sacheonensis]